MENNFLEKFLRMNFCVFKKKKNVFGNKILKNSFCSKKKTCFVKLTKKFFGTNKMKKHV